jgi:hypothetical protein
MVFFSTNFRRESSCDSNKVKHESISRESSVSSIKSKSKTSKPAKIKSKKGTVNSLLSMIIKKKSSIKKSNLTNHFANGKDGQNANTHSTLKMCAKKENGTESEEINSSNDLDDSVPSSQDKSKKK